VTHAAIHRLLFPLCFVFFSKAIADGEIELPVLPADGNEAVLMLSEGTLDSTVWRKVEPYYTMPLRVPQGDLAILQDLFPGLPDGLPAVPDALSRYQPWDDSAVIKFLENFPEIAPFRPILSFENGPAVPLPGQTGIYFTRRGAADPGRHYTLFSLGDPARAAASGRVDFSDAYGRWFRRAVTVVPLPGVRIACGNFSPSHRTPLFSGHFPSNSDADTAVSSNWLYGTARTWNGAAASLNRSHQKNGFSISGAEAFFHAGRSERIGQLESTASLFRRFIVSGAVSYLCALDTPDSARNLGFLNAGLRFSPAPRWKCECHGCVNIENPGAFSWQASVAHSAAGNSFKGTFAGVPAEYCAPRSETVRLMRSRAGTDSVTGYLLGSELSFRKKLGRFFSFAPRLNCLLTSGKPCYLHSGAEISGTCWCRYRFWYSWSPLFKGCGDSFRRQVSAECSLPVSERAFLDLSGGSVVRQDCRSGRIRITLPVTMNAALELAPVFTAYGSSSGTREKTAGIRQRLLLSRKTFSDMTIEQELPFSSWETIRVRGKMSFYL
jgi:hypothetical protein